MWIKLFQDVEKHVGFDTDVEDQSDRPNKLHRRDTPHHLKNKRINLTDSQKDHEKVCYQLLYTIKQITTHFFSFYKIIYR